MKSVFTCTVIFYNTPVFFRITPLDINEYLAEPVDYETPAFKLKKAYGEWHAEGNVSHSLAVQIGKLIDKSEVNNF